MYSSKTDVIIATPLSYSVSILTSILSVFSILTSILTSILSVLFCQYLVFSLVFLIALCIVCAYRKETVNECLSISRLGGWTVEVMKAARTSIFEPEVS